METIQGGADGPASDDSARLDDCERRITVLETGHVTLDRKVTDLASKMAEYNGENRSRAEAQERTAAKGFESIMKKIDQISSQVKNLGSVRGWVGWAIVTATSAGVASIVSHFWMHQ